ncbi:hypothetical protein UFOVP703_53 [uncultured Caudovirales phage]|uniref:Uncharacterized protein n=1 Tax=uncultured Caudovirales phage TaxID=2100421 RepID=A0A6J5NPW7_9CAUD|nr:hypothetical protein UFOVP703_53 [uncultured Caudovirales phage]
MTNQPPLNLSSGSDPYAQIRSLQFVTQPNYRPIAEDEWIYENTDEGTARRPPPGAVTLTNNEGNSSYAMPDGTGSATPVTPEGLADWKGLLGGFESKYNNFTLGADGTITGTLQRPGMHKYDTMTGTWKQGSDGRWSLTNDPSTMPTRQVSTSQRNRDVAEKFAAAAAIMATAAYGGTQLAALNAAAPTAVGTTAATTAAGTTAAGATAGAGMTVPSGFALAPSLGSGAAATTAASTAASTAATAAGMGGMWQGLAYGVGSGLISTLFGPDEPDMSGVNDAARSNAEISRGQLQLAERQYADAQKLFEEYKPMLNEQIQLSLEAARKSNQRSDAQWADYESIWRPTEKRLAEMSLDMASEGRISQEAQRSADETAGQYDEAIKANRDSLIASGANPEKVAAMEASMRLQAARGTGGAFGQGRRDAETKAIGVLDNSARFGRNMPSTGLATAALAGQQSGQATGGYTSLAGAAAAPGQNTLPFVQTAINANNASGSLFSDVANTQLRTSIARNNQVMGGIGAGLKLYGLTLGGP